MFRLPAPARDAPARGLADQPERVYRVYRELGLAVRRKKRKRVAQTNRRPRVVPIAANIQWSMEFMRDTLPPSGRALGAIARRRGRYPSRLVLDNGSECTSKALGLWAYECGVELVLNQHWFVSLRDARLEIDAWRQDYNRVRPHSALGGLPPAVFRKGAGPQPLNAASAPPISPAPPGERNAV